MHSDLHIVDAPLEHQGAQSQWLDLAGHQWVPAGEGEDVVWQVSGGVDTLGTVSVRDALQETEESQWRVLVLIQNVDLMQGPYRSWSGLRNSASELPPLGVLHLHEGPVEHMLHLGKGIAANGRCLDVLPGTTESEENIVPVYCNGAINYLNQQLLQEINIFLLYVTHTLEFLSIFE